MYIHIHLFHKHLRSVIYEYAIMLHEGNHCKKAQSEDKTNKWIDINQILLKI